MGLVASTAAPGAVAAPAGGLAAVQGIERLMRSVAVSELRGLSTVRLQLDGGRLGPIAVALRMRGGRVYTSLGVEQASEYALVRGALPQLEQALRERGLAIVPVELQLGAGAEQQHAGGGGGQLGSADAHPRSEHGAELSASLGARRPASALPRCRRRSPTDYIA
ncbi:MAG: flagellar hook-length control protein FliK [Proteobacteria bacterium]|nr:flagellar hook-length control protein FliK [Pseudomonadota bacterium]